MHRRKHLDCQHRAAAEVISEHWLIRPDDADGGLQPTVGNALSCSEKRVGLVGGIEEQMRETVGNL
jgi:hypothetical protein